MCRLNNMFWNNQWVKDKIFEKKFKTLEKSEDGNTAYQQFWEAAKVI